jgi:hypothetical protein
MEINEEKLKEILKEQREEYQRYSSIVIEEFTSQIKLLAESVSGIQKQLIALREMVSKNTKNIEIMKIDIAFIKNGLKKKIDIEEFEALERRIAILEAKAAS